MTTVHMEVLSYAGQAGFWAAATFPLVTALYWKWWRHLWGWTIVALDTAIACALFGNILVSEFGVSRAAISGSVFFWVEAVALWLVPLIIVWRACLTFVTQRRAPRGDQRPEQGRPEPIRSPE